MTSFPERRGGCRPRAGLRLLPFLLHLCLVLGTLSWSCSCLPRIFHFAAFLSSFYSLLMFNLLLPFTLTSPSLSLCLLLLSSSSSFLSSTFLCVTFLLAHLLCSFVFLFLLLPFPLPFLFLLCPKSIRKLVLLPPPPLQTSLHVVAILPFLKLDPQITPCSGLKVAPIVFWLEHLIWISLFLRLGTRLSAWPFQHSSLMTMDSVAASSCTLLKPSLQLDCPPSRLP